MTKKNTFVGTPVSEHGRIDMQSYLISVEAPRRETLLTLAIPSYLTFSPILVLDGARGD
jgi:hypothetical protein